MIATKELLQEAKKFEKDLIDFRRHIHAHPELSFDEHNTSNYVYEKLKGMNLSPKNGVGNTGVIADVGSGDKTVAIRTDMDALPISETNKVSYCSKNKGVMHACGHDAHTAMGLGAALLLSKHPPKNGRVRFVFQPAEEDTNNDGKSGATLMIEDGAFEGVGGVLSLHVFPDLEVGSIAVRSGPVLAACDKFEIKIHGKGSHGAYPELGLDPVVISSHVVQAIQSIVSRKSSALQPLVITVGGIRSNTYRPNIISDFVELTGTVRYFYDETQAIVRHELEQACRIARTMGGDFELNYVVENPAVINDERITSIIEETADSMLSNGSVSLAEMQMGGDDFSFLSRKFPSCYFFLGAKIENQPRKLHTETFDLDEKCLAVGSAMLAAAARKYLE